MGTFSISQILALFRKDKTHHAGNFVYVYLYFYFFNQVLIFFNQVIIMRFQEVDLWYKLLDKSLVMN